MRRTGDFDRAKVFGPFRRFCPTTSFDKLEDVPLEGLKARGKKLILLDVDNTLVKWKGEEFEEGVLAWLDQAKKLGFELCILSNTRRPARLERLSKTLEIPYIRDRFKPSPRMYQLALAKYGVKADEALMIGDQILTDVWGANRAGIEAAWVHKISDYEFIGTRANRYVERAILAFLYPALSVDQAEHLPAGRVERQFGKFIVVGGLSTLIDYGVFFFLYNWLSLGGTSAKSLVGEWLVHQAPSLFADPDKAAIVPFQTLATALAMVNSYLLNRAWTFSIQSREGRGKQAARFVILNLIVLALTTGMVFALSHALPTFLAKVLATGTMMFVNFFGQRLWAFKE